MDRFFFNPDGYRALAAAVILQAVKDARRGDSGAAAWLEDSGQDIYEAITGETVSSEFWIGWVRAKCPGGSVKKLTREKHAA